MPYENQIGSKDYLQSFVQPPRQAPAETPLCAWEFVLPSEIETTFGVKSTPARRRSRHAGKQDTTPVTSLKYNIHTPPRSGTSSRLLSASRSSLQSSGDSTAAGQAIPTSSSLPTMSTGLTHVVTIESSDDVAVEAHHNTLEENSASKRNDTAEAPQHKPLDSNLPALEVEWTGNLEELLRWPQLEDFFVTIPEWAVCSICSELFDCPVTWPNCDHTFCKACVTRILNYGHRECPLCRGVLPNDFGFDDLAASERMTSAVLLLPVRCRWGITSKRGPHAAPATLRSSPSSSSMASLSQFSIGPSSSSLGSVGSERASSISSLDAYMRELPEPKWMPRADFGGCPDIVPLSSLPSHLLTCPHAPTRCLHTGCRKILKRMDIDAHQTECPHKSAQCEHCHADFTRATLQLHFQVCPDVSVTCDCGETMLRKALPSHSTTLCPHAMLTCPFSRHGCTYSGKRSALEAHLATCPYEAVKGFIEHTEYRFQEYDRTIERLESMILALRAQVHNNSKNAPRAIPQMPSRTSNLTSPLAFPTPSSGQVGHGNRKGRFWDDYNQDGGSDEEFSIYL